MPRKYWWEATLPGQLAIVTNVLAKIGGHQAALGLTAAQVQYIEEICETYIAVYNYVELSRETAASLIEWRNDCFYVKGGSTPDTPPPFGTYTPPTNPVDDCVNEFKSQRDMIVNIPDVSLAILEDLMLVGEEQAPHSPSSIQPTVKVTPAATGYLASIVVSGRENSDMWEVWTLDKAATDWVLKGTYAGKSADIVFTPTPTGDPYQFQVRIQLRKANANYGQPSDAVTVTVNP